MIIQPTRAVDGESRKHVARCTQNGSPAHGTAYGRSHCITAEPNVQAHGRWQHGARLQILLQFAFPVGALPVLLVQHLSFLPHARRTATTTIITPSAETAATTTVASSASIANVQAHGQWQHSSRLCILLQPFLQIGALPVLRL